MEVDDGRRRRLYIAHGGCQSPSAPRHLVTKKAALGTRGTCERVVDTRPSFSE